LRSKQQIQLILFDLGNVLVELNGFPWFQHENSELTLDEIHRRWVSLDSIKLFETGKINEKDFFEMAFKELDLNNYRKNIGNIENLESFEKKFRHWVINFLPGAGHLLKELKNEFQIACLSNTNTCHINHLKSISTELSLFDHCFFSHEIGFIKPDPQAFLHVSNALSIKTENIFFLDDSKDNVNIAIQCGMNAKQVFGLEEAKLALNELMREAAVSLDSD